MGKLIVVVGSTGVGKTTLVDLLCKQAGFVPGLEEHASRPFQAYFKINPGYALANQMDYMILRGEQEAGIRAGNQTGVLDGGLEMDFHGFTRLFAEKGWLQPEEFDTCRRLYEQVRSMLPPPDLVIHLTAPHAVIEQRLLGRERINVAGIEDADRLEALLSEWLATLDPARVITVDVSADDPGYTKIIPGLLDTIRQRLAA